MPWLPTRMKLRLRDVGRALAFALPLASVIGSFGVAPGIVSTLTTSALASPAGDACRKEICDNAVAECMRADLALNPFARTESEKKQYCGTFFPGCMTRSVTPDVAWYSPDTVARFLKCPS